MMILTSIYRQLNKERAKWPFFYVYRLSSSQASTKLFVKADRTISSGVKWTVKKFCHFVGNLEEFVES